MGEVLACDVTNYVIPFIVRQLIQRNVMNL